MKTHNYSDMRMQSDGRGDTWVDPDLQMKGATLRRHMQVMLEAQGNFRTVMEPIARKVLEPDYFDPDNGYTSWSATPGDKPGTVVFEGHMHDPRMQTLFVRETVQF